MTQRLLVVLGVVVGAYGAWLLLSRQDLDQLTNAGIWLAAGVVLHDFVLAPVALVVLALATRIPTAAVRAPAVVGLVVLGSVTLVAIPMLGRFGARSDNATLLDRHYGVGWLALAGLVVLAVGASSLVRSRRGIIHPTPQPVEE